MNSSTKKTTLLIFGFIIVLSIWIIIYLLKIYNPLILPSPLQVFKKFIFMFTKVNFIQSFVNTFIRIIISFSISAVIGIIIGLIVGYYKLLDDLTKGIVDFIRSIPGIAFFPLFILFFGVGELSRLMVSLVIAIPIIIIETKYGVIYSNKLRKNLGKLYNLSKYKLFTKIIIPEVSPYIFTSLKVALSLTIIVVLVTEMIIGTSFGLGNLLILSQFQFETDMMFALIILLGLIGLLLNLVFNLIEKKIFHWR